MTNNTVVALIATVRALMLTTAVPIPALHTSCSTVHTSCTTAVIMRKAHNTATLLLIHRLCLLLMYHLLLLLLQLQLQLPLFVAPAFAANVAFTAAAVAASVTDTLLFASWIWVVDNDCWLWFVTRRRTTTVRIVLFVRIEFPEADTILIVSILDRC